MSVAENSQPPTLTEADAARVSAIKDAVTQEEPVESENPRRATRGSKRARRGRGRPRKDGRPNKADLAAIGLGADPLEPPTTGPISNSEASEIPAEPIEIPVAVLKPVLQFPFNIARAKTKFEGFKLDDDQAEALCPLLDQVMKRYFPQIQGESAPLVVLLGSLAMIAGQQTMQYFEWKADQQKSDQNAATTTGKSGVSSPFSPLFPITEANGEASKAQSN